MAYMSSQAMVLAGPAEIGSQQDLAGRLEHNGGGHQAPSPLQQHVAELYGRGFRRAQIAKALAPHICEQRDDEDRAKHLKRVRATLLGWERTKWFRDLVWEGAGRRLDMETPAILQAVANSAKRGRVDAARLALEVAGRHVPNETRIVTAVQVNIANGLPRPGDQS